MLALMSMNIFFALGMISLTPVNENKATQNIKITSNQLQTTGNIDNIFVSIIFVKMQFHLYKSNTKLGIGFGTCIPNTFTLLCNEFINMTYADDHSEAVKIYWHEIHSKYFRETSKNWKILMAAFACKYFQKQIMLRKEGSKIDQSTILHIFCQVYSSHFDDETRQGILSHLKGKVNVHTFTVELDKTDKSSIIIVSDISDLKKKAIYNTFMPLISFNPANNLELCLIRSLAHKNTITLHSNLCQCYIASVIETLQTRKPGEYILDAAKPEKIILDKAREFLQREFVRNKGIEQLLLIGKQNCTYNGKKIWYASNASDDELFLFSKIIKTNNDKLAVAEDLCMLISNVVEYLHFILLMKIYTVLSKRTTGCVEFIELGKNLPNKEFKQYLALGRELYASKGNFAEKIEIFMNRHATKDNTENELEKSEIKETKDVTELLYIITNRSMQNF